MTDTNDVQSALSAGMMLGDPREVPPGSVFTVVPRDAKLESLEQFHERPYRIRRQLRMFDCDSFIEYVNAFSDRAKTRIFFDAEKETFTAILDYHETGTPNWCDHIAAFACRRTVEFATWMGKNKAAMPQVEFAHFIEDNLPDIVEPPGATLLEIAKTLEAKKEVNFSSGIRLENGQVQFLYEEILRGSAAKNTLEIPEQFVLGVAIFEGGPAYRIPVRLRYRIHEQKLVFGYDIVRPHRFLQDALRETRDRIAEKTGLAVLAGAAS